MNDIFSKWVFPAMGFSLLVNVFLFALLPLFVQRELNKGNMETIIPINVIQFKRHERPPPEKEELPQREQPEKYIPTVMLHLQAKPRPQNLEIETPNLSFEINPRLGGGMPVAPPAVKFKDFYDQDELDQVPMAMFKMKPVYPYRARRLNINGKVSVKFLVDGNGYVSNIKVLKSAPPGIFDESVLKALPSWRFSPGKVRGHAVSTWVVTTIEFDME